MRDIPDRWILACALAVLFIAPAALSGQEQKEEAPADSARHNEGIVDPLQEKEAERIEKAAKAEKPWNRGDDQETEKEASQTETGS